MTIAGARSTEALGAPASYEENREGLRRAARSLSLAESVAQATAAAASGSPVSSSVFSPLRMYGMPPAA